MRSGDRDADPLPVLRGIALFSGLDDRQLRTLASSSRWCTLGRGEVLCRTGDEGDAMYAVEQGQLEVFGGSDGESLIARLGPGDVVGELALLLGEPRSATVVASGSSRLVCIERAAFQRTCREHPAVLEVLIQLLARRAAAMARGAVAAPTTTNVLVTGRRGLAGKTIVADALAALLAHLGGQPALLLTVGGAPAGGESAPALSAAGHLSTDALERATRERAGGAWLHVTGDDAPDDGAVAALLDRLGRRYRWVVVDVARDAQAWTDAFERAAHRVVEIVRTPTRAAGRGRRVGDRLEVLNLANPRTPPIPIVSCEPFVLPVDPMLEVADPARRTQAVVSDPYAPASRPLYRLARRMLGATVGVALGGGAAFGLSHLGVLAALEAGGIPIDLVVGSSMGAIVGAGFATGMRPRDMIDVARQIATPLATLGVAADLTVSRPGVLSGDRIARLVAPLVPRRGRFEDLLLPYRAVAADVETGERIAIASGDVEHAYRASAAVPILWSPLRIDGRVLIDGSMVDPVPAEVAYEMGADLCIAVNVVPQLRRGVQTVLARWYHRLSHLNPIARLGGTQGMPSVFDIGMNTIQMVQHQLGRYRALTADVQIMPDLAEFTWIEFYRAPEIIARGLAAGERAVPKIRALIDERLGRGT